MLLIRDEQLAILSRAMRARFHHEAYEHVRRYFPDRCVVLGPQGTLDAVRDGLERARSFGFESRCDLLRYLNLLFEFGPEFEGSEANAWARPYLEPTYGSPTFRMDRLMEEVFRRLYPAESSDQPAPQDAEEEADGQFDGIVWDSSGIDPNYVPRSIKPEYEPIDRPIKPGSIPLDQLPQPDDDDEGAGIGIDPDDDEEEGDGRR